METVGERIRRIRKDLGMTLVQLSNLTGIGQGHLSQIERGTRKNPSVDTLEKIAKGLGISLNVLTGGLPDFLMVKNESGNINILQNPPFSSPNYVEELVKRNEILIKNLVTKMKAEDKQLDMYEARLVRVPIIGEIKAGYDMFADQNVLGYELMSKDVVDEGPCFYLRVKGDSMIDEGIREGFRVLVRKQDYVDNGKIGVVLVNDDEATLKRVYYQEDGETVVLQAANRNVPPRVLPISDILIQGQVVKVEFDV